MPNREEIHVCKEQALAGLAAATTGTVTGVGLDTLGFDSAHLCLHWGATAPTPTSITIEESDVLGSGYTTCAAADIIDDGGAHAVSTTRRIAYIGKKRYVRAVVVLSASSILTITGHCGYAEQKPTDNPV